MAPDHGMRRSVGVRILVALGSLHVTHRWDPRIPRDMGRINAHRRRNDTTTLRTIGMPDHLSASLAASAHGRCGRRLERRTSGPGRGGRLKRPRASGFWPPLPAYERAYGQA